ncbi:purine/pyrimidine permease [Bacillus tianshenii]|nr:purine/pyrimidine permease [Bacillus tianshenii]
MQKYLLPSLQWFLFIISGNIVAPIAIASSYGMSPELTIEFISRTFIVLAVSGLLQVMFGHRLPINEGPAGLWWGIFTLYSNLGLVLFGSTEQTLQVLEFSLLISGVISIGLSMFGLIDKLSNYFSPAVTGTYLLLLVAQLSGSFLNGVLGVEGKEGQISPTFAVVSLVLVAVAFVFSTHHKLKKIGIIGSLSVGWLMFIVFGLAEKVKLPDSIVSIPKVFAFGIPHVDWSVVPTVAVITLLLITNMLASVKIVESVLKMEKVKVEDVSLKKTGVFMGVGQILAGLFSAIGPVPISGSGGFIASSRITSKIPFIIASALIIVGSLFTPFIAFISALPPAVGYAAIFPVFAGMTSLGIKELLQAADVESTIKKVGFPLFVGIGVMFVPSEAFSSLPAIIGSVLSNGLVLGTLIALIIEVVSSNDN